MIIDTDANAQPPVDDGFPNALVEKLREHNLDRREYLTPCEAWREVRVAEFSIETKSSLAAHGLDPYEFLCEADARSAVRDIVRECNPPKSVKSWYPIEGSRAERVEALSANLKRRSVNDILDRKPAQPISREVCEQAVSASEAFRLENKVEADEAPTESENIGIIEQARPCLFDPSAPPPIDVSVASLGGVSMGRKGGVSVIQAQKKAGKTAFLEGKCAALLSEGHDGDFLGWSCDDSCDGVVLHFDCEQSASDHWDFCQRVAKRAQISPSDPRWRSYCVNDWEPEGIIELIGAEVEFHRTTGIKEVVIDGYGDLVKSVNDETECNGIVRWLMGIAKEADAHVSGVLHLNPAAQGGWAKSRGHLGSQLERKAETIIQIERDEEKEISSAYTSASRKAPINKKDAIRFAFDREKGGWALLPSKAEEKAKERMEAERKEHAKMVATLAKIWKAKDREPSDYAEVTFQSGKLVDLIGRHIGKQEGVSKAFLGKMKKAGFVRKLTEENNLSPFGLTELGITEVEAAKSP